MPRHLANTLRTTRLEVARQLPELAPRLEREQDAIKQAVFGRLTAHNVDPASVPAVDINRVERHAIVAALSAEQKEGLLEGEGTDQRFIKPYRSLASCVRGRQPRDFADAVTHTLASGHKTLAARYSQRHDPDRRWWPSVSQRYAQLGLAMRDLVDEPRAYIRAETMTLEHALSSVTLGGAVEELAQFVEGCKNDYPANEGPKVTHDLSYIATMQAGRSLLDTAFRTPITELKARIVTDGNGKYVIDRQAENNWDEVFDFHDSSQEGMMMTTTLKCPVHTALLSGQEETTLTNYVHAAINLAPDYRFLVSSY